MKDLKLKLSSKNTRLTQEQQDKICEVMDNLVKVFSNCGIMEVTITLGNEWVTVNVKDETIFTWDAAEEKKEG